MCRLSADKMFMNLSYFLLQHYIQHCQCENYGTFSLPHVAPQVHVVTTRHNCLFCLLLVDSMNINLLVMRICFRTLCHKSAMIIMKLLFAAFSLFFRSWNGMYDPFFVVACLRVNCSTSS